MRKKGNKEAWRKGYEKMLDQIGYTQEVEDTIAEFREAEQDGRSRTADNSSSAQVKGNDAETGGKLNSTVPGPEHGDIEEWLEREGVAMLLQMLQTDSEFRKKVASLASEQN